MYITGSTVVAAGAFLAAVVAIAGYYNKIFTWIEKQNRQDTDIRAIKTEQTILVRGILACLKGLQEQGCDGEVTQAVCAIENHLNKTAHK